MTITVGIIGGGASGMCAAIEAARNGAKVLLFEQHDQLGKKILATGNGRCNFTNEYMSAHNYYCNRTDFVSELLLKYDTMYVINYFKDLGVLAKKRETYYYPLTDQASTIRDALELEVEELGVTIYRSSPVSKIEIRSENSFTIYCKRSNFLCDRLILATGGNSGLPKKTPYDGFTLPYYTNHSLNKAHSALAPLIINHMDLKQLAGIRTDIKVEAWIGNQCIRTEEGELQLTDYGLSGIPIFQISRLFRENREDQFVILDFLPSISEKSLKEILHQRILSNGMKPSVLRGILKEKLANFILNELKKNIVHLNQSEKLDSNFQLVYINELCKLIKGFKIFITRAREIQHAQVTAGGIPTDEVMPTLESIFHKGLYITGELLDVDGVCGGYNLHMAWVTGIEAGRAASKR